MEVTIPVPGGRPIRAWLNLRDEISSRMYFFGYTGGYEPETTAFFLKLLESKRCVIDVGANVGYYALLAAAKLEGRGEVHAFEPGEGPYRTLATAARLSGFNSIVCNHAAVSDYDGYISFYMPSNGAWTLGTTEPGFELNDRATTTTVPCRSLASYCAEKGIGRVDLLKIDAEGADLSVLAGFVPLFDASKPDVLCEVLPGYEEGLNRFFAERNYSAFLLTEQGPQPVASLAANHQFRDYYFTPR